MDAVLALVITGPAAEVMVTWLEVEVQGELPVMVHWNTLFPAASPVTVETGEPGVVMVPDPLIRVHVPVPVIGVLPASVAVVPQMAWAGPASAMVGAGCMVIPAVAEAAAQPPAAAMVLVSV